MFWEKITGLTNPIESFCSGLDRTRNNPWKDSNARYSEAFQKGQFVIYLAH